MRRALALVGQWWDGVLEEPHGWPLSTGEIETRMHKHDNKLGHDRDLHISLTLGDYLTGRRVWTIRAWSPP